MASSIYDPDMKLYKFTPNSKVIRTNIRNQQIIRSVNSEGFMDLERSEIKENGIYRIGFFGDSYVESIQVPIEKTFFRLIEDNLKDKKVESLAFGRSGHGPIHSYLKSKKYSKYYDIDMVVYVFCENDLGDQIEEIKQANTLPYVKINKGDLILNDNLLNKEVQARNRLLYVFYNKSIVIQTIYKRLKMLLKYGVKIFANQNDFTMSGRGDLSNVPNQNDPPSTWNIKYKEEAILAAESVILNWYKNTKLNDKEFAIFYIPRSAEWKKEDLYQDSWKHWLKNFCKQNQIQFIDPTKHFFEYDSLGKEIYDDHFSEDGHVAFSNSFIEWYKKTKVEN